MTACPLTAPDVPITEDAATFERLWRERAIARAFKTCHCGAWGQYPCRTASGAIARERHRGRS